MSVSRNTWRPARRRSLAPCSRGQPSGYRMNTSSWGQRRCSEIVEERAGISLRPDADPAWHRKPGIMDVDQLHIVEVDLDVIATHVRAQRVPCSRGHLHLDPLHLDPTTVL